MLIPVESIARHRPDAGMQSIAGLMVSTGMQSIARYRSDAGMQIDSMRSKAKPRDGAGMQSHWCIKSKTYYPSFIICT